jgi:hypothetical protein
MDSSKDILEKGTILKGLGFCITWMIKFESAVGASFLDDSRRDALRKDRL